MFHHSLGCQGFQTLRSKLLEASATIAPNNALLFSKFADARGKMLYMDISSGGGPQGNCQQVDAWICKIAWIFPKGMCVFIVQFLQGVLLKNNMTHHFQVHFLQLRPPFDIGIAFLNLSFLARKPRLRILLKRLAEAPDPLAFLLWYLGP